MNIRFVFSAVRPALVGAAIVAAVAFPATTPAQSPNIVIILADDVGAPS